MVDLSAFSRNGADRRNTLLKHISKCEKRIGRLRDEERQYENIVQNDSSALIQLLQVRDELRRLYSIIIAYNAELSALDTDRLE